MQRLTSHFTFEELTRTDVASLQTTNRVLAKQYMPSLIALANLLEQVRTLLGDRPIIVHSAFRCAPLNRAIGGSATSQHLMGQAADFHVRGLDLRVAFDQIRASGLKWGQLILEDGNGDGVPTWLHLSLGPPWRSAARSQQVLVYDGRTYKGV